VSTFRATLAADAPIVPSARTPFDDTARQEQDARSLASQLFLAECLVNGTVATYVRLNVASAAATKGDIVVRSTASDTFTVERGTAVPLAAAGIAYGIVLRAAAPGTLALIAIDGAVGPDVTGLATALAGPVRVSTAARAERVAVYAINDFPLGHVDASGWLTLARAFQVGSIDVGALVASVTGNAPLSFTAGISPVGSVAAASGSVPGSMSAAHFTKLEGIGAGAGVVSVAVVAPVTNTGTATEVILNVSTASGAAAGSMSAAHFTLVNNATDAATANALSRRNAQADISYNVVNASKLAVSGESSTFASDIGMTPKVETYAANIEMEGREGGKHEVILTGNVTFDVPVAHAVGSTLKVRVIQGGSGSYTATWANPGSGGFAFPAGMSGTLIATSVGDADYFEFEHWSTPISHWMCSIHVKYSPP
jgi:hypothetical protein